LAVTHRRGWPFVGREHELRSVETALRSGAGVLLLGESGVGKTRLVREVLARWSAAGGDCEWVVATPAAAVPFGAVAHLVPAGVRLSGDAPATLDQIAEEYARRRSRRPMMLGIDDAHLLDDASAGLVRRLAVHGLVVPVASAASEAGRSTVLAEARRLTVHPLPPPAVDQILRHALPGQVDAISRRRLHRLVAGNPLLLRELLADAVESGALARREGVWCWRGPVPATARLAELVSARLAAMSPAARSVIETVACGQLASLPLPLPLALLARVAGSDAIEEARESGLVVADHPAVTGAAQRATQRLRFAHPLYAEVLRATLPASRARRIGALLADAQAGEPMRRRDDALLTAAWQLQSGHIRDPKLLLLAAREASSRLNLDLAERLARAAQGPEVGWEADWLLARILLSRGRPEGAARVLPGPPDSRGERLAMWTVTRARLLYWGAGRPDEALRALDAVAPDEPGGDLTESSRAWILLFDGRGRHALLTATAVLGRSAASDQASASARNAGAAAAGALGRLGYALQVRGPGPAAAPGVCLALRLAGHLDEAAALAQDGYRAAVASDSGPATGVWAALRGMVFKAQGHAVEAQAALREALVLLGEYDTYRLSRLCLAELAGACALTGDLDAAREYLTRADRADCGANRLFDAWVELNRAWLRAAEGELSTSVDIALRAATLAQESDQPAYELVCRYDAVRIGGPGAAGEGGWARRAGGREVQRLREAAVVVEGRVAPLLVAVAEGLAADDGPALERAAAGLAGEGQALLAAEAAAAAARAFWQAGQRAQMRRAAQRAAELAGRCRGVRTPLLEHAGRVGLLSRREREVAALAASQSSRQIADRLGLSVHTVNNTLARAFAKLGVGNRGELATLFGGDPLARYGLVSSWARTAEESGSTRARMSA
jgi:DNA-binding CsgD family transcriptional regulator